MPWLLPPALSDLETVNEIGADRPGMRGKISEKIRQTADFEHWPAFFKSFVRLTAMIGEVATHPDGPATVTVLSGDVHHSYAARAHLDEARWPSPTVPVHQLVCSPVHNKVPRYVKSVFSVSWQKRLAPVMRRWARRRGAPELPVTWTDTCGPLFGNTIATLELQQRNAEVIFEQPRDANVLRVVCRVPLTPPA